MSFESFERHQAKELEQQGNKEYGIDKDNAEDKANPEIADKTLEQQRKDMEKNKETQEKMDASKEKISNLENMDLKNEQTVINSINEQIDGEMWPPIEFDDTNAEVVSQIGHTEGGTSLDRNVES